MHIHDIHFFFVVDLQAFAHNSAHQPECDQIIVKRERNPIIKCEKDMNSIPYETEVIPKFGSKTHIASLQTEKDKVIQELLTVKAEHQKLTLELKHKQQEILNLNRSLLETKQRGEGEIQCLKTEIQDLKQKFEAENLKLLESTKEISSLKRDKALLSAQVKQIQSNVCQKPRSPEKESLMDSESDEEYEVECIQSHKIIRGERHFYVKWKGYSDDSWLKEKDLANCPLILEAYLKQHNLGKASTIRKRNRRLQQ